MSEESSSNGSQRRRRRNSSLAKRVHSHVKLDSLNTSLGLPGVVQPSSSSIDVRESVPVIMVRPAESAVDLLGSDYHDTTGESKESSSVSERSMGDGKESSLSEMMEVAGASQSDGMTASGGSFANGVLEGADDGQFVLHHEQHLFGPGGRILVGRSDVRSVLPNETASILCVTWNLAAKTPRTPKSLQSLLHPADVHVSPDIYCISFQELASTNMCFHMDVVTLLAVAVGNDHVPFCWVRRWSQMVLVLVRKTLLPYVTDAEWQFIPSSTWAKPVRTKGAIAVCFRLFHAVILLVGCHLSYGPHANRVSDYKKISRSLRFDKITKSTKPAVQSADVVIWFGDLNFRITDRLAMNALLTTPPTPTGVLEGRRDSHWTNVLINDQLSLDMNAGNIFQQFKEAPIRFAPTHKLLVGTNNYHPRRVPSYTDRVLYRNNTESNTAIVPLIYNSVWSETISDHKPVYAVFLIRVIKEQRA